MIQAPLESIYCECGRSGERAQRRWPDRRAHPEAAQRGRRASSATHDLACVVMDSSWACLWGPAAVLQRPSCHLFRFPLYFPAAISPPRSPPPAPGSEIFAGLVVVGGKWHLALGAACGGPCSATSAGCGTQLAPAPPFGRAPSPTLACTLQPASKPRSSPAADAQPCPASRHRLAHACWRAAPGCQSPTHAAPVV
jgi:hypothetical protein